MAQNKRIHGSNARALMTILIFCGSCALPLALLYNESNIEKILFDSNRTLSQSTKERVVESRLIFLVIGAGCITFAISMSRSRRFKEADVKPIVTNIALATFCALAPFLTLELLLRPIIHTGDSVFIEDEQLGWRLRPGADALWGFSDIKINNKGLIGPELDYARRGDSRRVLYLGDSVTFGFGLESYDQAYPYIVEKIMRENFGINTETVNAGVGGYSPWQEYIYLKSEGFKYSPDAIIIGFVLNDVTEKSSLKRFGGPETSFQLLGEAVTPLAKIVQRRGPHSKPRQGSIQRTMDDHPGEFEQGTLLLQGHGHTRGSHYFPLQASG